MGRIAALTVRANAPSISFDTRAADAIAFAAKAIAFFGEARIQPNRVRAFTARVRIRTAFVRAFSTRVRVQAAEVIALPGEVRASLDRVRVCAAKARAFPARARIRIARISTPAACMRIPPAGVENMTTRTRIVQDGWGVQPAGNARTGQAQRGRIG